MVGDTEVWEIVNLTADAHPIHTHLTQFQLMNRQNFNVNKYNGAYNAAFPGGLFIGGYGPPLDYNTGNLRALGGNPDITPYLQGGDAHCRALCPYGFCYGSGHKRAEVSL